MSLNIRTEPMENRRLSLFVEVDQERVDQELRKAARKVGGEYRIPGFRKGKAPYSIVVQYVGLPSSVQRVPRHARQRNLQASRRTGRNRALRHGLARHLHARAAVRTISRSRWNPPSTWATTAACAWTRKSRKSPTKRSTRCLQACGRSCAGWTDVERPSEYGDMLTIDVKSVLVQDENAAERRRRRRRDGCARRRRLGRHAG